jgi:hypothetical protein
MVRPPRPFTGADNGMTAVNGNTVTFSTPFHITLKKEYGPNCRVMAPGVRLSDPVVSRVGIEDLYIHGGTGGHGNVSLAVCAYCWVKNIESLLRFKSLAVGQSLEWRRQRPSGHVLPKTREDANVHARWLRANHGAIRSERPKQESLRVCAFKDSVL